MFAVVIDFAVDFTRLCKWFLNKIWFFAGERFCAAARYAAVPTNPVGDHFVTDSQESGYFQTKEKPCHKEKDIQKSVRSIQEICLFEFPFLNLISAASFQFSNTEQFVITYMCVNILSGWQTGCHILVMQHTSKTTVSTSYTIDNSGCFLGSKAAGACSWSLTSI